MEQPEIKDIVLYALFCWILLGYGYYTRYTLKYFEIKPSILIKFIGGPLVWMLLGMSNLKNVLKKYISI